jgi:hypothetical protein
MNLKCPKTNERWCHPAYNCSWLHLHIPTIVQAYQEDQQVGITLLRIKKSPLIKERLRKPEQGSKPFLENKERLPDKD